MQADSGFSTGGMEALWAALAERARSVWSCPDGGRNADHRLVTYRDAGGHLICAARSGSIFSETRIAAALCGTDHGCGGQWRCIDPDNEVEAGNL